MNRTIIATSPTVVPYETFTLSIPKTDTSFFRAITKKMGWTAKKNRKNMSSYERSLDDVANGRVSEYASAEEFFKKMGILFGNNMKTSCCF